MIKLRAAAFALLLAALLAPAALGGVMEADGVAAQPSPTPVAADSSNAPSTAAPEESDNSTDDLIESVFALVESVLALF